MRVDKQDIIQDSNILLSVEYLRSYIKTQLQATFTMLYYGRYYKYIMWYRPSLILLLLFINITLICSYEIRALETGTVVFEDKFIKLNTCMAKKVQLKLTKDYYHKNKDISVIVSMSGLKMDDQLAFYIYHNLNCNKRFCELQINLQRYTPEVKKMFNYEVTVDYLIAHGIKTVDFNMTFYKQHFQIPEFVQNMKVEEWTAIPIPYGFSDMKLSGNIKHEITAQSSAYKLTYVDPNNLGSTSTLQNWGLSKKFVLYKVLFLPKSYLQNSQNRQQFLQFVGFQSTSRNQLVAQLYFNNQNEIVLQSNSPQQEVSFYRIPIKKTEIFNQSRQHPLLPKQSVQVQSSSTFSRMLFGVAFLVLLEISYLMYKKKVNDRLLNSKNEGAIFPDLIVSFDEMRKNAGNQSIKSTQAYTERTSN